MATLKHGDTEKYSGIMSSDLHPHTGGWVANYETELNNR